MLLFNEYFYVPRKGKMSEMEDDITTMAMLSLAVVDRPLGWNLHSFLSNENFSLWLIVCFVPSNQASNSSGCHHGVLVMLLSCGRAVCVLGASAQC